MAHITNSERIDLVIAGVVIAVLVLAAMTGMTMWFVWLIRWLE